MEISPIQPYSWDVLYNYPLPLLFPPYQFLQNYVHSTETPESYIFSADIPGVRKEEIKVEVEDSRYMIFRTEMEAADEETNPSEGARSFMRKFRLPSGVDVEGITAGYENGVLTVTVPRCHVRRGFYIDPSDMLDANNTLGSNTARAA